ncbi:MAG: UDP-N-acetylglucosamine 2-epimerase (non-hydrolyzing) [Candidatus Pacebacteria bacterium CG10_big_fil_rev_8_21_14_0_10_56_10]|nr:MAG: UDP-N-acetylglucosamine 2-epimerase (non-hydrolyzing) [Candidatus Pacebacteria bacterium CG10_big_fil_rev_8_21_14_0_10_56_10]
MLAVLVGTRPEIIKMAPVLRLLKKKGIEHLFIHSDQHYSQEMDQAVIADLKLHQPDYHLQVRSGTHAIQTGKTMAMLEEICFQRYPSFLLVHGDTNTTLAGALTAKKLHIKIGHVEAGLRSFDYRMPEEVNRILVDRISDVLFAPTARAKANLLNEGIEDSTIVITGNTVVDALRQHQRLAERTRVLSKLGVTKDQYVLVTAHRPENVEDKAVFTKLLALLDFVHRRTKLPLVWPLHPRTSGCLAKFGLKLPSCVIDCPPVGYLHMLKLIGHARLIMTDSGGIQEEAYILRKPLLTLRDSTERPETMSANFIVHVDMAKAAQALKAYRMNQVVWTDSLGDGTASQKIVEELQRHL